MYWLRFERTWCPSERYRHGEAIRKSLAPSVAANRPERKLTMSCQFESKMSGDDEIELVAIPSFHLKDSPGTKKRDLLNTFAFSHGISEKK